MCKTSLDCSELAWTFKYYWNCYKHLDPCYKCLDLCPDIHVTDLDIWTHATNVQASILPIQTSGPPDDLNHGPTG